MGGSIRSRLIYQETLLEDSSWNLKLPSILWRQNQFNTTIMGYESLDRIYQISVRYWMMLFLLLQEQPVFNEALPWIWIYPVQFYEPWPLTLTGHILMKFCMKSYAAQLWLLWSYRMLLRIPLHTIGMDMSKAQCYNLYTTNQCKKKIWNYCKGMRHLIMECRSNLKITVILPCLVIHYPSKMVQWTIQSIFSTLGLTSKTHPTSSCWNVDWASNHMTSSSTNLTNVHEYTGDLQIHSP